MAAARTSVRVVLHNKGFNELRTSAGVVADLNQRANGMASAAGEGMEVRSARTNSTGKRARATVYTSTYAARRAESENRALSRAIGGGRW